jgi:hypothetical protein
VRVLTSASEDGESTALRLTWRASCAEFLDMSVGQQIVLRIELTPSASPAQTAPLELRPKGLTHPVAPQLLSTAARAPAIRPVVRWETAHTMTSTRLTEVGCAAPRAW